jgi:hypothetical protein
MINLDRFALSIYSKDYVVFSSFFEKDAIILGYSIKGYFDFITRNLIFYKDKKINVFTQLIHIKLSDYIVRIFFNEILILEENFKISEKNIIETTCYKTDCFGKLIIYNKKMDRALTIRAKKGVVLKQVFFLNENLDGELSINEGNLFNDGFFLGHFKIFNDDYKTKITKIKIVTNKGIENQYVVLRGLDFPFFNLNKPIINKNVVLLTEDINKIYKLVVTFIDNDSVELDEITQNKLVFNKDILKVYQSIDGCAMNYFIDNEYNS